MTCNQFTAPSSHNKMVDIALFCSKSSEEEMRQMQNTQLMQFDTCACSWSQYRGTDEVLRHCFCHNLFRYTS